MIKLILSPLMSCILATYPHPADIENYIACQVVETKLESVSRWQPLIEEYFKEEDVARAMLIVYCESRGKEKAVGKNKDGTFDVGLWQFNDNTWAWLKPKLNITSSRYNPKVSTAVASWLVYNDTQNKYGNGWYHWNSSKHCWGD